MSAPPRPAAPPPGLQVGGYRLLSRLGEGGMGVVHLGQRPGERPVALKVLRPHVVGDQEGRRRLAQEVNSLSRVRSVRVAEVVDADPWGPVPFVATRHVAGPSLDDLVRDSGPLHGDALDRFAMHLAEALDAVHRVGVLHRDVKPSNVLIEDGSPVLIDFGLARLAEDPRLTQTGWLVGTPGYLAPEILYGEDATTASDVHAWAATTAYAGIGRPPFGRGPAVAVMDRVRRGEHDLSGLDPELRAVVEAAMAPDPSDRPTLRELLAWLDDGTRPEPTIQVRRDRWAGAATAGEAPRYVQPTLVVPEEPPADWQQRSEEWGEERGEQWGHPWDEPGPPAPSTAERARGAVLLALTGGFGAAAVGLAPWVTLAVLLTLVWLVRSGAGAWSAADERQRYRGRRWYDSTLTLLSTPVHLLASIPGTLLLAGWSIGTAVAAGLIALALALPLQSALPLMGTGLVLGLWIGPGSGGFRRPVATAARRLGRSVVPWVLATVLLTALVVTALAEGRSGSPDWTPWQDAPWNDVPGFGMW